MLSVIEFYKTTNNLRKTSTRFNLNRHQVKKILIEGSVPINSKRYTCNHTFFKNIDTPEKAYWLGFLYADGYIKKVKAKSGNPVYYLRVHLHVKDVSTLEKLKIALESNHLIKIQKNKNSVMLSICSEELVKDLVDKGCGFNKSLTIQYPVWLSDDLHSHFIRGYFDGDGWVFVAKNREYRFGACSGSYEFISTLQSILIEKCSLNKVKISNQENCYKFSYGGYNNIICIRDFLYKNCGDSFMSRKKDIFDSIKAYTTILCRSCGTAVVTASKNEHKHKYCSVCIKKRHLIASKKHYHKNKRRAYNEKQKT